MGVDLSTVVTVLLPGTGSDDLYVRRVFGAAFAEAGAVLVTPEPDPRRLIAGYLDALDDAARHGPIAVGGVSLGAAVAARWACEHQHAAVAVLAALPAWIGEPADAPAALSARHTAAQLRRHGLQEVTAAMQSSSPAWLSRELSRSWRRQWPHLPAAMEEAAGYRSPTPAELAGLRVPMGVVGAPDDPIHPIEVARLWAGAAPRTALRTVTLEQFGPQPQRLGAACLAALDSAH
ncbi:MAG: alpha/beta hydrolase [Mycobacteriaceae bacterium]